MTLRQMQALLYGHGNLAYTLRYANILLVASCYGQDVILEVVSLKALKDPREDSQNERRTRRTNDMLPPGLCIRAWV
ncbi:MAG: hypothetical protein H0W02_04715 [Ktedonobacteraceae bacterium]|nr:hypothetical protein [Ktedonobacteraceae bacterium]